MGLTAHIQLDTDFFFNQTQIANTAFLGCKTCTSGKPTFSTHKFHMVKCETSPGIGLGIRGSPGTTAPPILRVECTMHERLLL